jgi:hypothetical protein
MLFQRRFHAGIRDGSVTVTFRAWKTAKARPGAVHRLGPDDAIEIESVARFAPAKITTKEAARAGFADRTELLELLSKRGPGASVFRVAFHYVRRADPRTARCVDTSAAALDGVLARLERMDRLSRRSEWTRAVLELIAAHPRTAASKLAPELGRETRAFKADVRKLKELGLTESHEVGYSLSPRGTRMLRRLREAK